MECIGRLLRRTYGQRGRALDSFGCARARDHWSGGSGRARRLGDSHHRIGRGQCAATLFAERLSLRANGESGWPSPASRDWAVDGVGS